MKLDIIAKKGESKGKIDMPKQFDETVRQDIITRAVEVEQANNRQAYGASSEAGKRHSIAISKRRHDYRGTYGIGQSRTPRKVMSRSGTRMNWSGAFAPQTVGGRRAHPPKAYKVWTKKLNKKELNLAIRSAMSATLDKELAEKRNKLPDNYPFIIDDEITKLGKTKDVKNFLKEIGLKDDLERAEERKVRPGKGKSRGRKYKKKKSALIIAAKDCELLKSAKNIPGIDIVKAEDLTVELLAPGAQPGRLTLWTKEAVEKIGKEKLYM